MPTKAKGGPAGPKKDVGVQVAPELFTLHPSLGGRAIRPPPGRGHEAQRKVNLEARERVRAAFDRACGADPTVTWREAEGDPVRLLAEAAHAPTW